MRSKFPLSLDYEPKSVGTPTGVLPVFLVSIPAIVACIVYACDILGWTVRISLEWFLFVPFVLGGASVTGLAYCIPWPPWRWRWYLLALALINATGVLLAGYCYFAAAAAFP